MLLNMRIVYLDADFSSATGETGPRSFAFARRLIARGHDVMMLTSDRQFDVPDDAGHVFNTQVDGVPVAALNVGLRRHKSRVSQIWHHLRFILAATRYLLKSSPPDVLYVTSPPLSAILPTVVNKWLRHVPFVLEVREIWPEVPHGIDQIRSRLLVFLLRRLALLGYRRAAAIVGLTESAVNHIQADIPLTPKTTRVAACCDIDLFASGNRDAIRQQQHWENKFVCLHLGPMIHSAGLEAILRVADALREDEQFVFWLVGNGDQRRELERNIHNRTLHNVILWDDIQRSQLPDVLAAADLCLLTMRRYRVLEQTSGNRLFDCLAAGKPVLLNYSGWQRDLLEKHRAGLGTTQGRPEEFFENICRLCDRPNLRADMGRNARHLAETEYHPDQWIDRLEQVLSNAVNRSPSPPSQT
jgi:glycosyltransferase involved in cell wall biosynthesis